jgi:hypothetical protein
MTGDRFKRCRGGNPVALGVLLALAAAQLHAEQPTVAGEQALNLPYGFYSEHFGAAAAYVYGRVGYPQPQAAAIATVMAGTKGSALAFGMLKDFRFGFSDRVFLDAYVQAGYFVDARSYSDGNPDFPGETAGRNDSDEDDYIEGDGADVALRLHLKWVLPIGAGRERPMDFDVLDNGLPLEDAGDYGLLADPLQTGRTYVELRPFYRSQQFDLGATNESLRTNGFEFALFHDNRDFVRSPSRGGSYRLRWSEDWGWADSSSEWNAFAFEADRYVSLGASEGFRQRVLAFNVWTANSPSWNKSGSDDDADPGYQRPPAYAGATLGGLFRMRGYPASRFNDKAAMYYAVEARVIPHWNPFTRWQWLQERVGVQWWQWVLFGEAGRVAGKWDLDELHSDMKWDVGAGVRLMAKGLVVRADLAFSEEDYGIQMFIGQPFQF